MAPRTYSAPRASWPTGAGRMPSALGLASLEVRGSPLNLAGIADKLGVTREVQSIGVALTGVGRSADDYAAVDTNDGGVGRRSGAVK